MGKIWVCAEYEADLQKVQKLKIIMHMSTETGLKLASGRLVNVSGRDYMLGERHIQEDNFIDYELIKHTVVKKDGP